VAADAPDAPKVPVAIAVPDIPAQAEEAASLLRTVRIGAAAPPDVTEISQRAPLLHEHVRGRLADTVRTLDAGPSLATLDTMLEPWMALRNRADAWIEVVTTRARDLEEELRKLEEARARWLLTQQAAQTGDVPQPVLERVSATLTEIASVRDRVAASRDHALVLLDRITQERGRCDEALARIGQARKAVVGRLFVRDRQPVWQESLVTTSWAAVVERVGQVLAVEVGTLREHVDEHGARLLGQLIAIVGLFLALVRMRSTARRWVALDDSLVPILRPLEFPVACALFIVLLLYDTIVPIEQRLMRELLGLVALVPVARLLTALVDPWLARGIVALGAFFLFDRIRGLLFPVPSLEQVMFLVEMTAVLLALAWLRRGMHRTASAVVHTRRAHVAAQLAGALQIVVAGAVIAGALGYMRFARVLEIAVLGSSYVAAVLVVAVRVTEALVGYALRVRPLRLLRIVQEHRLTIERRLRRMLRLIAIAAWVISVLAALALWDTVVEDGSAVLGARFARGELSLSLGDVLAFAVTVWIAFAVSSVIRFVLQEDVFPRLRLGRGLPASLSSLVHYFILLVGFFLGLAALGLDLNRVTLLAGAFGVGIGFGLQNIVNNFVSGLILLIERPIQVGETVQIGDLLGEVHRIGIRSSTVRTWEGAEVIVPNGNLISDRVTNWTLSDRMRRIELPVGVEYGSDPDRVVEILLEVARGQEGVLPDPVPQALFLGFGDSALNFELRAWTARTDGRFEDWIVTRSDLALAVHRGLGAAGIAIPFPQREVIVHMAPDDEGGLPRPRARG
jgi:small-conductance mechanosensitive channel